MFDGLYTDAFSVAPYIDRSTSDLVWNIGAGASANNTPNILSELTYEKLKSSGWGINLGYLKKLNNQWAFNIEADIATSKIKNGDVQDSDYEGNNRTEEFSRSYADAEGDGINRKSLALGFKYRWFSTKGHYAGILLGKQDYNFDILMVNGVQIIPDEYSGMSIPNLNSTYESTFDSTFLSLSSEHVFEWGTVGVRYEYHLAEFDAKANRNLREEFAHPVSFAHTAEGDGATLTIGSTYTLDRSWDVFATWTQRQFDFEDGYDHTFFADGESVVLRLNEVEYKAEVLQGGVRYIF